MGVMSVASIMGMMSVMQTICAQQAQASGATGQDVTSPFVGLLILGLAVIALVVIVGAIGIASEASGSLSAARSEITEKSVARAHYTGREGRRSMDEISNQYLEAEYHNAIGMTAGKRQ